MKVRELRELLETFDQESEIVAAPSRFELDAATDRIHDDTDTTNLFPVSKVINGGHLNRRKPDQNLVIITYNQMMQIGAGWSYEELMAIKEPDETEEPPPS